MLIKDPPSQSADAPAAAGPMVAVGEFMLSLEADVLMRGDEVIPLGQRAVAVLRELAKRPGEVVSKAQLLRDAWLDKSGRQSIVEPGSLQVQIYNLRQVLGKEAIKTVMDRGYRLALPVSLPMSGASQFPVPLIAEPLIGREADEAALVSHLRQHRLVTLLGGSGVGKTSLAAQMAGRLPRESVQWLELAALRDEDSLVRMMAAATRVKLGEDASLGALVAALKDQSAFLVLDNAEHLVDLVAHLCATLHTHCPKVACLVTSQVPLRVAGEQVYLLTPLGLPDEGAPDERVMASPAVQLFISVAESRGMHSSWLRELRTLARIVRALSGNPLAIHHVASHAHVMDLDHAGESVDTLFHLSRADPNEPLRHRTLQDAFDWSHGLLGKASRQLFHLLARFPAGLDLAHLGVVSSGLGLGETACQAALRDLVDRSFVFRRPYSQRVMIPEAARHYSHLWLQDQARQGVPEADHLDRTLLVIMDAIARKALSEFIRMPYQAWTDRFSPEWDNLHAGILAARRLDLPSEQVRISCAAWTMWVQGERGYWVVHLREQLTPALLARVSPEVKFEWQVLDALTLLRPSGRTLLASPDLRARLAREEPWTLIALLGADACMYCDVDPAYSKACSKEAVALMRAEPAMPPLQCLLLLGSAQQALADGDARRARMEVDRGLAVAELCGPGSRAHALIVAVQLAAQVQDLGRLNDLWQRFQEWGKPVVGRQRLQLLVRFAHGYLELGNPQRALAALQAIAEMESGFAELDVFVMDYFASIAHHLKQPALAAGMLVASDFAHERLQLVRDRIMADIRDRLARGIPEADFNAARDGLPVTVGEAMAVCREWCAALQARI